MPIKKRSTNSQGFQEDYVHLQSKYNESSVNNPSHFTPDKTNFNLKEINLEDIDQSLFNEFHNRFIINNKPMPLILLDAELLSLQNDNYVQYDSEKGFLNLPFFTFYRKESQIIRRTNPGFKQVVFTVPKTKAQGLVFEEYITEAPIERLLIYELTFISNYREFTNEMDKNMTDYFRNKRNVYSCNGERFVVGPVDQNKIVDLEIINRENVEQRTLYLSTYNIRTWCFTRDLSKMQKRERPNTFDLNITMNDGTGSTSSDSTQIGHYNIDTDKYPTRNDS